MKSRIFLGLFTLELAALLLSPLDLLAFKELALADTGAAHPLSSLGPRYNPAVIAELGNRWDGGQAIVYQNCHVKIQGSTNPSFNQLASTTQCKWYPIGIFGFIRKLSPSITVGFSSDGTRSFKGSVSQGLNAFGTSRLGADVINGILLSTIAWKANACHSFGFSLPVYIGRVRFKGFQNIALASPPVSVSPNHVTNHSYNWAVGVGLRFGWLWHVTPQFNVGVAYTSRLIASHSFRKFRGFLVNKGKLDNAPIIRVGVAYTRGAATFIAESHWTFYKQARSTGNFANSTALLGSKNGPGLGWRTIATVGLALEYRFSELLTFRAGWAHFFPVHITSSNITANFLDPFFFTRQACTLGATYESSGYEFSGTLYFSFPRTVHGKPSPSLANGSMTVYADVPAIQAFIEIGRRF